LNLGRRKRDTLLRQLGWVHGKKNADVGTAEHHASAIDWKRILARDPFECLQSLICQLMSGAEAHSSEAELLMNFLESSLEMAPVKIGRAFSRGLALRGSSDRCFDEYPFCLYSLSYGLLRNPQSNHNSCLLQFHLTLSFANFLRNRFSDVVVVAIDD